MKTDDPSNDPSIVKSGNRNIFLFPLDIIVKIFPYVGQILEKTKNKKNYNWNPKSVLGRPQERG